MLGEMFPPRFPSDLAAAAFTAGAEAAWRPVSACAAVQWLASDGFAVLGTELWLLPSGAIQTLPMGLSGTREIHGNAVNRASDESWNSFVRRAAKETPLYLESFNPSDIAEEGEVFFSVVWTSESEFDELRPR